MTTTVIKTRHPDAVLASALADALTEDDETAAERWGVGPADIIAARRRTATDSGFDRLYRRALTRALSKWRTAQATSAVLASRELVRRLAEERESVSTIELVAVQRAAAEALIQASAFAADDPEGHDDLDEETSTRSRPLALEAGK